MPTETMLMADYLKKNSPSPYFDAGAFTTDLTGRNNSGNLKQTHKQSVHCVSTH